MSSPPPAPFVAARRRMVDEQLRARGVDDPAVLAAMGSVPREAFAGGADAVNPGRAYADVALPAIRGQTLSQPYIVGAMTGALGLRDGGRVLEVGTGTGYQAAVLAKVADEVWTIERDPVLARTARERLEELDIRNVHYRVGDGTLGWPEAGPFDGILVTAGAPSIPTPLVEQLAPDGALVIPVGTRELQELLRVHREGDQVHARVLMDCRFVPLLGDQGWRPPTA